MQNAFFKALLILILASLSCNVPFSTPTAPIIPAATQAQPPTSAPQPVNPTPAPFSSITGLVWHDLCGLPTLGPLPSPLPPGCVPSGDTAEANGIRESGEPGIQGIQVDLHQGGCNEPVMASRLTATDGSYSFEPISEAGTFCITVNPGAPPNDSLLIPGGWTYPSKGASIAQTIVLLSPGQSYQIDFGWDHQFLP